MSAVAQTSRKRVQSSDVLAEDFAGWGERTEQARVQVAEMQRARLLAAATGALVEFGYADVTIADITARARVSRRTFYELFEHRDDCLMAVLEDVLARVREDVAAAVRGGCGWRERLSAGMWAILMSFDRDPALARVCMIESARGNEAMLAWRMRVLAELARIVDEGRTESARGKDVPPLTAEGLVGAVHAIVYERVLARSPKLLVSLHSELIGLIVLPYLGVAAAKRERARPAPPACAQVRPSIVEDCSGGLRGLPMRLTYRTVRVLHTIAANPDISNRAVSRQAEVGDQGQMSKLLARLERLGLIANSGRGRAKGEPNVWRLTALGEELTQSMRLRTEEKNACAAPSAGTPDSREGR